MIETERLLLRQYTPADHSAYLAMCAEPEVTRYLNGHTLSAEDGWNRILRYAGHWALLGYGVFAVVEKASGRYLGETGLADFHRGLGGQFDGGGEAAWVFAAQAHGRGYAFEAAQAAHRWYADHVGQRRTVCLIDPANAPSLRLAARLGYAPFGETIYRDRPAIMLERLARD